MNEYQPQQYYGYYSAQYDPMAVFTAGMISFILWTAIIAWGISMVRKAIKGEPVEPPVYYPPA